LLLLIFGGKSHLSRRRLRRNSAVWKPAFARPKDRLSDTHFVLILTNFGHGLATRNSGCLVAIILVLAIKETAEALGNTPAVCRSAYICPHVLDSFERGRVIERYFETVEELVNYRGRHLHQAERALLRLLRRKNGGNGRT
jgi:hypothetical protein